MTQDWFHTPGFHSEQGNLSSFPEEARSLDIVSSGAQAQCYTLASAPPLKTFQLQSRFRSEKAPPRNTVASPILSLFR